MKIQLHPAAKMQGSVLMSCLMTAVTIGVTLASYLIMIQNQNVSVYRSQSWNSSITLAEAGVEDALQHLNSDEVNNMIFTANGWKSDGYGGYELTRTLKDGYYYVKIEQPTSFSPIITSEGFAPYTYVAAQAPMFAVIGTTNYNTTSTKKYLSRKVQVRTKIDSLIKIPMAAKDTIDFKGFNVSTDSFDSADPNYSTNGFYDPDPAKTKDNGDVVTNSTITNSFNVGNAKIKGTIRTGPRGFPKIGSGGSVGDTTWVEGGSTGIQSGHFADDMNVTWPDVKLPSGVNFMTAPISNVKLPGPGGVTNTFKYYLTSGYWLVDDVTLNMYVAGDAVVYVPSTGRVNMTGQDMIYIPPGNSLKMFVGVASASMGGQGVINENGNALGFTYMGLPSNTALDLKGNAKTAAVIYAPNADYTLRGSGQDVYDFVGASVSKTVQMNGHFKFHYDENLRKTGLNRGYIATLWKEL